MSAVIRENPYLKNTSRAPQELAQLLQGLPHFASQIEATDTDTLQQAAAAAQHADNARATLLSGLEALGTIIFVAGVNDDHGLRNDTIADLGCLIQHLAVELQMLNEVQQEFGRIREGSAA